MCAYLRQYSFTIRHIPGSVNCVADWLSRFYHPAHMPELQDASQQVGVSDGPSLPLEDVYTIDEPETVAEMLEHAHGPTHVGIRTTYVNLCRHYLGHGITQRRVMDFVMECPTCQKERHASQDALVQRHRSVRLKGSFPRRCIGLDTLTITPADKHGYKYLVVVTMMVQKMVALYPVKEHDAISTARSLMSFYATYGTFDELASDNGTEFMNEVVQALLAWLGVTHRISLADRHKSNGVEGTNKQVLRHLRTLCLDRACSNA